MTILLAIFPRMKVEKGINIVASAKRLNKPPDSANHRKKIVYNKEHLVRKTLARKSTKHDKISIQAHRINHKINDSKYMLTGE